MEIVQCIKDVLANMVYQHLSKIYLKSVIYLCIFLGNKLLRNNLIMNILNGRKWYNNENNVFVDFVNNFVFAFTAHVSIISQQVSSAMQPAVQQMASDTEASGCQITEVQESNLLIDTNLTCPQSLSRPLSGRKQSWLPLKCSKREIAPFLLHF